MAYVAQLTQSLLCLLVATLGGKDLSLESLELGTELRCLSRLSHATWVLSEADVLQLRGGKLEAGMIFSRCDLKPSCPGRPGAMIRS